MPHPNHKPKAGSPRNPSGVPHPRFLRVGLFQTCLARFPETISAWVPHPQVLEGAGFPNALGAHTETFVARDVEISYLVRRKSELSFRPERADAFSSRSLRANASACAVEEPRLNRSTASKRSDLARKEN